MSSEPRSLVCPHCGERRFWHVEEVWADAWLYVDAGGVRDMVAEGREVEDERLLCSGCDEEVTADMLTPAPVAPVNHG